MDNKNHVMDNKNHVVTGNKNHIKEIYMKDNKNDGIFSSSLQITYIACHDKCLYALNHTTKTLLWKYNTNGLCTSAPLATTDATRDSLDLVYVTLLTGKVLAIEQLTGRLEWQFVAGKPVFTSPGFFGRRRIVFGCADGALYCLEAIHGSLLWKFDTDSPIFSSPTITDYYYGDHDSHSKNYFKSENSTSKKCQQCTTDVKNEPDNSYDYVESENPRKRCKQDFTTVENEPDPNFHCAEESKSTSKKFKQESSTDTKKHLFCCFGSNDGYLYTLDKQGCLVWKSRIGIPVVSSPAILNPIAESKENFSASDALNSTDYPIISRNVATVDPKIPRFIVKQDHSESNASKSLDPVNPIISQFPVKQDHSESDSSMTTTITTTKKSVVPIVFCIDTKGGFHMCHLDTGTMITLCGMTHSGREVFSSPVVIGNRIVFGSRDDNVYFLETS